MVADPGAQGLDDAGAAAALLHAVRDSARIVRLPPDQLREIAQRPVVDLTDCRLGRIGEWCQPRYALDERFVSLAMLVDHGGDSPGGRWRTSNGRHDNLRQVLVDVSEPAMVLLGPAGCGKSTLLRRLELDLAAQGLRETTDLVTFFVAPNAYPGPAGEDSPPLAVWLETQWSRHYPALPPLREFMASGRLVLLLDGLNEMPSRDPSH